MKYRIYFPRRFSCVCIFVAVCNIEIVIKSSLKLCNFLFHHVLSLSGLTACPFVFSDSKCFIQIQQTIEVLFNAHKKGIARTVAVSAVLSVVMFGCESIPARVSADANPTTALSALSPDSTALPASLPLCELDAGTGSDPVDEPEAWTGEELTAIALTLAGECYDHKAQDKRRVCEVILNRVSDGRLGNSILDVLTAKNQFNGYWVQNRPVSENDYEVARQALRDWHDGGCKPLSEYLFFCAGENLENQFRCEY